ncbi:MAG: hypothetical protein P4L27_11860 [Ignavibacteriaceae bacterium]|nr:hypothetical protein [Ignavibacteriaceae bacterium]
MSNIFLTIGGGALSVFTPWLNIPKRTYYSVNRFLVAPLWMQASLLSASMVRVVGRGAKGVRPY